MAAQYLPFANSAVFHLAVHPSPHYPILTSTCSYNPEDGASHHIQFPYTCASVLLFVNWHFHILLQHQRWTEASVEASFYIPPSQK